MQQLALRANLLFNDLVIKSVFNDLPKLTQESKSLDEGDDATYTDIAKVFYIKTSSPVEITLTQGMITSTLVVNDSCLLSDSYDSIEVENTVELTTAEIFVVCS